LTRPFEALDAVAGRRRTARTLDCRLDAVVFGDVNETLAADEQRRSLACGSASVSLLYPSLAVA
jgi:hypothetical protein